MGFLQDTAWLLLGVTLGTVTCSLLVGPPPLDATISATISMAPLASMTVFVMLASTLHGASETSRVCR